MDINLIYQSNKKKKLMKNLILLMIFGLAIIGCNKTGENHPCYDSSIVHDSQCPTDCPEIVGCDGETYCNECEAARNGIKPM